MKAWPSRRPLTAVRLYFCLSLPLLCTACPVFSQQPDTLEGTLPEVQVEAARASVSEAAAPFAITVLDRTSQAIALEPGLTLDAALRPLPGVWTSDRSHFALGEQLSIRGMGARSAFGVRGIQVLLDGIPLTLPDGQSVADIIDPAFIRRVEVIRGPSSLYWGNGSAGVLYFSTDQPADAFTVRGRALGGSYGLRQFSAEVAVPAGRHRFHAFASDVRQDGFRAYSEGRFTRAAVHTNLSLGPSTQLRVVAAAADQRTQHPGSLTALQVEEDPRLADPRYVATASGKTSTQVQAGATLLQQTRAGLLSATAYGLVRDLDNPLPFAYILLNRTAGGGRLAFQHEAGWLGWGVSADAGLQRDGRINRDNVEGRPGDALMLDQVETVDMIAASAYLSAQLTQALRFVLGLRSDRIHFSLDDRLFDNGDQSGSRTFSAWSPALGASYRLGPVFLFANYSTAFETPTTTELVNRPGQDGGFNPDLAPQRTHGFEIGARGTWPEALLSLDVALFHLDVRDRLVPFQTPDGDDRTFYRNAGRNKQDGVEVALTWQPRRFVTLQGAYTGSRFVFEEAGLQGNSLPGIPAHHFYAGLQTSFSGFWSRLELEVVSSYYADDENNAKNGGYAVVDWNAGHEGFLIGRAVLQPFLQVGNVLDARYNGSVSVNAAGDRYYEPAPGRTVQAGLNLSF